MNRIDLMTTREASNVAAAYVGARLHDETTAFVTKELMRGDDRDREDRPKTLTSFERGVEKLRALLKQRPRKRLYQCESSYFEDKYMSELFEKIKAVFEPQIISFNQYRNWRISCWMEIARSQRQAGLNRTPISKELLRVMRPCLEKCDAYFRRTYRQVHGIFSIKKLRRLQSFVTRYRPRPKESALLRHVDGMLVDGSIVVGLPTDVPFSGGGLTIWDGHPDNPDATYHEPVKSGDIVFLDHLVWHQANPIGSGERWALVIFYSVKDGSYGENKDKSGRKTLSTEDALADAKHAIN